MNKVGWNAGWRLLCLLGFISPLQAPWDPALVPDLLHRRQNRTPQKELVFTSIPISTRKGAPFHLRLPSSHVKLPESDLAATTLCQGREGHHKLGAKCPASFHLDCSFALYDIQYHYPDQLTFDTLCASLWWHCSDILPTSLVSDVTQEKRRWQVWYDDNKLDNSR